MRPRALDIKVVLMIIFFLTGINLKTYISPKEAFCEEPIPESSVDPVGFEDLNPVNLARDITQDSLSFITAPARFTPKDWLITGITLGGIGALMVFDEDIQKSVQDNRSSTVDDLSKIVKPFGEGRVVVPAFLGLSLLGSAINNPSMQDLGLTALESLAVDGIFVGTLQAVLGRARPVKGKGSNSYDPFITGGSFPSGHTSVVFNIATVLSERYKDHKVVPILSYSLAGLVGFSRINDNQHFASDVLAGAALGIATAKLTLHRREDRRLSLVPQISEDYRGLAVNYRW